jgi:Copper transport outer membrane protein, MctB
VEVPDLVINLRYHIVSLVAVFLALALGIVVGSTVLREGTVTVQRAISNEVRAQSEQIRAENARLNAKLASYEQFSAGVLPSLLRDKLKDQAVVLVDTDRVDDATRDKVTQAVEAAAGGVDGRITFATDRLALAGEGDRTALAEVLGDQGAQAGDPDALRANLVGQLADRLTVSSRLPQDEAARPADVLTGLQDADFLADLPLKAPFRSGDVVFPRQGTLFVLIGPTEQTTLPPSAFLVPLADRLSDRGDVVVAVERADGPASWVTALREDGDVTDRVSSVDGVDLPPGQFALVEALQRRLQRQATGQYGTKAGASGLLPEGLPGS